MQNTTRIADIIHFHGLTLMVYTHDGLQYIAAKPLVDLAAIDWRSAKKSIHEADNAILYGTTRLNLAENAPHGGISPPMKQTTMPFCAFALTALTCFWLASTPHA